MELTPRAMTDNAKAKKRETLLNAAKEAFDKNSYKSINMKQIAQLASVSKGTLFVYFKSKEHLLVEVLFREYQIRYDRIMASLDNLEDDSDASFVDFFLTEFEHMLVADSTYLQLEMIKATLFETIETDEGLAEVDSKMNQNAFEICAAVIKKFPQISMEKIYELWTVEELMLISYANTMILQNRFEMVPTSEHLKRYFIDFIELALKNNGFQR